MNVIQLVPLVTLLLLSLSNPSSTSLPHQNTNHGDSLSELGITEFDADGNPVRSSTGKQPNISGQSSSRSLNKYGKKFKYLIYSKKFTKELEKSFNKYEKQNDLNVHSSIVKAAAYYGIEEKRLAQFFADKRCTRADVRTVDDIQDWENVIPNIQMKLLREIAKEIRKYDAEEKEVGESSRGSQSK